MIKPTISELTQEKMNRYELVIAIAKCARKVTDEYVEQRERADRMIANRKYTRLCLRAFPSDQQGFPLPPCELPLTFLSWA